MTISETTKHKLDLIKQVMKDQFDRDPKNQKLLLKWAAQYSGLKVGDILVAKSGNLEIQNTNKAVRKFKVLDIDQDTEILLAGEIIIPNKIGTVFPLFYYDTDSLTYGGWTGFPRMLTYYISFKDQDGVYSYKNHCQLTFELDSGAVFHTILDQEGTYDALEKNKRNNDIAKEIKAYNKENRIVDPDHKASSIHTYLTKAAPGEVMWRSAKNKLTIKTIKKIPVSPNNRHSWYYMDRVFDENKGKYINTWFAPNDFEITFEENDETWIIEDFHNKNLFRNPPRSRKEIPNE